jgi:hypothetical protein
LPDWGALIVVFEQPHRALEVALGVLAIAVLSLPHHFMPDFSPERIMSFIPFMAIAAFVVDLAKATAPP